MWEINDNFLIFKKENSPLIFTTIKNLIDEIFKKRYDIKEEIIATGKVKNIKYARGEPNIRIEE